MHNTKEHNTAILIFALSSHEELKRKKIKNGTQLFNALSEHTLKTVQKTNLPYFLVTEKTQKGNSFGERFTNAIQSIYNKGFEKIIAIGNDSPQLTASHLLDAYDHLKNGKTVIGPSADGGFYLLGLQRDVFYANNFGNLPWQTSKLAHQLKSALIASNNDLILLKALFDIDNLRDLKIISKFSKQLSLYIKKIILSIINPKIKVYGIYFLRLGRFQSIINQNRGSPILQFA